MDETVLLQAVRAKVEALQAELLAKVEANLSGEVLQPRSGALEASVAATLDVGDGIIAATVASTGVPYAAIQEYGGVIAPHEILPVKARALALAGGGFARRVRHPGSAVPARAYLGGALDALRDEIANGLKATVLAASVPTEKGLQP